MVVAWALIILVRSSLSRAFLPLPRVVGPRHLVRARLLRAAAKDTNAGPEEILYQHIADAIHFRGSSRGFAALKKLGKISSSRLPYTFHNQSTSNNECEEFPLISFQQKLLPEELTASLLHETRSMESRGSFSTDPDSVDGIPSLHLNLIASGQPVVPEGIVDASSIKGGVHRLISMVRQHLYEKLLPRVQQLVGRELEIDEVFLRRYGTDVERCSITAHYDVTAIATAVIALDNSAATGRNGLYTTLASSNHVSLRRFFTLCKGDAVVHSWDVLHGVDVEEDVQRTSLIVWFKPLEKPAGDNNIATWISQRRDFEENGVAQFVFGSAIESSSTPGKYLVHPHDLCIQSASLGNAFALDRLGNLCSEGDLSSARVTQVAAMLLALQPSLKSLRSPLARERQRLQNGAASAKEISVLLWYEGALRGLATSQLSLGYALMAKARDKPECQDLRVLSALFCSFAEQQGEHDAYDFAMEVLRLEVQSLQITSNEEFVSSPVHRTINSWRSS